MEQFSNPGPRQFSFQFEGLRRVGANNPCDLEHGSLLPAHTNANRMPALAKHIPPYVEFVTIIGDADNAGRTNARALAQALAQAGRACRLIFPSDRNAA